MKRKPFKVDLIDPSISCGKTCKRHEACAKLFTEFSNMANLVNLRENPRQNPTKMVSEHYSNQQSKWKVCLQTWQIWLTFEKILVKILPKWSLNSIQISNLNGKSACKTISPFNQSSHFHLK